MIRPWRIILKILFKQSVVMNNKQTSNPAEKSVVHIWEKVEIVLKLKVHTQIHILK